MNEASAAQAMPEVRDPPAGHHVQGSMLKLTVGAIGIVFGDIGTSPLYAFRETFGGHHSPAPVDKLHIFGVLSLIFWSMMIVVTLKYVIILMRADNKGEGGSLALLALISRKTEDAKWGTRRIILLGVFACALFYGDSMITPAVSVLSAVEGLVVVQSSLQPFVLPIAVGILIGLFMIQRHGTAAVGAMFGPVMLVYFFDPGGARRDQHRRRSRRHPRRSIRSGRVRFFVDRAVPRLRRAGLGGPRRDRRRGALCRYGPFRAAADQGGLAVRRAARP